jgi:hypothetical protein
VSQCVFQFDAAAADIALLLADDADVRAGIHRSAGFFDFLFVYQDTASQDERLRPLTGWRKPFYCQQLIESFFHPMGRFPAYFQQFNRGFMTFLLSAGSITSYDRMVTLVRALA